MGPAPRALILTAGLLPLLAPYELLIRSGWRGDFSALRLFFLLISAGAVAITLFAIYAALFGLSQRIRFDSAGQVITHGFKAALLRSREKRYPFHAVETLRVKTHEWSDGPATYNLALTLTGAPEIEFGRCTERAARASLATAPPALQEKRIARLEQASR